MFACGAVYVVLDLEFDDIEQSRVRYDATRYDIIKFFFFQIVASHSHWEKTSAKEGILYRYKKMLQQTCRVIFSVQ